jgi:hypothetical protein
VFVPMNRDDALQVVAERTRQLDLWRHRLPLLSLELAGRRLVRDDRLLVDEVLMVGPAKKRGWPRRTADVDPRQALEGRAGARPGTGWAGGGRAHHPRSASGRPSQPVRIRATESNDRLGGRRQAQTYAVGAVPRRAERRRRARPESRRLEFEAVARSESRVDAIENVIATVASVGDMITIDAGRQRPARRARPLCRRRLR